MEEGIYQRQYFWGEELRKRDVYLGIVGVDRLTVVVELIEVEGRYKPDQSDGPTRAHVLELPLSRTDRRILFEKGVINSTESLEKVEGSLEKVTEDLHSLARKKVETMRHLHLIP